jgi:DNA-binding transcriptional MerR regulator
VTWSVSTVTVFTVTVFSGIVQPVDAISPVEEQLTIDDLARRVDLPVRTIREYQAMRLLAPPEKRGRVGIYTDVHVERLELIARLQRRGYSLAGIRDLLEAFGSGSDLASLLGVDRSSVAMDETPLRLTKSELLERVPGMRTPTLRKAQAIGLVSPDGPEYFLVRSSALLGLVADGVGVGVALPNMLDLVGVLIEQVDVLAHQVASSILEKIWRPVIGTDNADALPALLARGRLLLLQGVASVLADRLGSALLASAGDGAGAEELRSTIDRIRIGAFTDSSGAYHQWSSR